MSLEPHWFSTIYGVLFMVGQALAALALRDRRGRAARARPAPFARRRRRASTFHDLGKLMLAFVMLWAYFAFSQFLIIWSGNLPEEIPWYLQRAAGRLAVGRARARRSSTSSLPFLLLLSRDVKRNPRLLGRGRGADPRACASSTSSGWSRPTRRHHGGGASMLHWLDLAAPLGVGGLWLWSLRAQLQRRPLLPLGDPETPRAARRTRRRDATRATRPRPCRTAASTRRVEHEQLDVDAWSVARWRSLLARDDDARGRGDSGLLVLLLGATRGGPTRRRPPLARRRPEPPAARAAPADAVRRATSKRCARRSAAAASLRLGGRSAGHRAHPDREAMRRTRAATAPAPACDAARRRHAGRRPPRGSRPDRRRRSLPTGGAPASRARPRAETPR